jgi:predicted ATPase
MKLTIKNIGVIKEADIELSGLTVIAGENDSGKSTVGFFLLNIQFCLLSPQVLYYLLHH